jgi:hypothetical protein
MIKIDIKNQSQQICGDGGNRRRWEMLSCLLGLLPCHFDAFNCVCAANIKQLPLPMPPCSRVFFHGGVLFCGMFYHHTQQGVSFWRGNM